MATKITEADYNSMKLPPVDIAYLKSTWQYFQKHGKWEVFNLSVNIANIFNLGENTILTTFVPEVVNLHNGTMSCAIEI